MRASVYASVPPCQNDFPTDVFILYIQWKFATLILFLDVGGAMEESKHPKESFSKLDVNSWRIHFVLQGPGCYNVHFTGTFLDDRLTWPKRFIYRRKGFLLYE